MHDGLLIALLLPGVHIDPGNGEGQHDCDEAHEHRHEGLGVRSGRTDRLSPGGERCQHLGGRRRRPHDRLQNQADALPDRFGQKAPDAPRGEEDPRVIEHEPGDDIAQQRSNLLAG